MKKRKPKVSVVICAWNAGNCIANVLKSLKSQTFKDFEIVVSDDGSTDNTAEVSKSYGARVISKHHQGLSAARNVGIQNSRANIVAIIDADCHATSKWVEEIYNTISQGEIIVTGNTKIPKSTFLGDCISALGYPGGGHLGFENMWKVDKKGYTHHLAGGNCAFRKNEILALGAFEPKLTITCDDVFLAMKIQENNYKIKYNPKMIMYHPARKSILPFFHWHYTRGRGQYFFKKQVKSFGQFYKLRLWSTKNLIKKYWYSPKLPLALFLLGASFAVQKWGYYDQFARGK
jgi:O-antigen biosynthesis protein